MVVVFGAGRQGSNLILEVLTASPFFLPSDYPEDQLLLKRDIVYPYNYLCKCDSVYCDSYGMLGTFMKKNISALIVWPIRHPFDTAMSKVKRGYGHADDASLKGCVKDMFYNAYLYKEATNEFSDRIISVKMENVILDVEKEAKRLSNFVGVPYIEEMKFPYKRMKHEGKKERYPDKLYKSEISKYKNWKKAYDGFLTTVDFSMEDLFAKLKPLLKTFDYEE
jgi:hypothetical protein